MKLIKVLIVLLNTKMHIKDDLEDDMSEGGCMANKDVSMHRCSKSEPNNFSEHIVLIKIHVFFSFFFHTSHHVPSI